MIIGYLDPWGKLCTVSGLGPSARVPNRAEPQPSPGHRS